MSDLVDYLRDKLEHADDVVCTCTYADFPAGRFLWDFRKGCPIHEEQRRAELEQARARFEAAMADGKYRTVYLPPDPPPKRKSWWRR
jgi:hypothetical protein